MALEVIWTKEAENQLDQIIEYLAENWTPRETQKFFNALEKGIVTIRSKPLQQKRSLRKEGAYEYQVAPQTTLFYEFDAHTVTVMLLWSNKMNPEKLK